MLEKKCRHCSVVLVVGMNWPPGPAKNRDYRCGSCATKFTQKWQADRPNYMKKYYEANKARMIEQSRAWNKANPEKRVLFVKKYRDRKRIAKTRSAGSAA